MSRIARSPILSSVSRAVLIAACIVVTLTGSTAAQDSIEQLMRQLRQPIASGRVEAAQKLATFGVHATAASDQLIESLHAPENDLRLAAAFALGCVQTDPAKSLAALAPLLSDTDQHVRYSAQWSIARIAASLKADVNPALASDLASILNTAIEEMSRREHQPRHLISVKIAHSRIAQLVVPTAALPPVAASSQTNDDATARNVLDHQLAVDVYANTDLVGRYKLVHKLSDWSAFPDSMRQLVIRSESRQGDGRVLQFAMQAWGDRGQVLLQDVFTERTTNNQWSDEDSTLLNALRPASAQQRQQLILLAANSKHAIEFRCAALHALARCRELESETVDQWIAMILDPNADQVLRVSAIEALSEAGPMAATCTNELSALLSSTSNSELVAPLSRALVRIAPLSPEAFAAVRKRLIECDKSDWNYSELVRVCGEFGAHASDAVPQLVSGLSNPDSYARMECCNALESIGASAVGASMVLADRVADPLEEVSVKAAAAKALAAIGPRGLTMLAERLKTRDQQSMADVLRAIAVAGSQADNMIEPSYAILTDAKIAAETRAAAAMALGAMKNSALSAAPQLAELADDPEQPIALRSAALLALANIDTERTTTVIEAVESDELPLLMRSIAFAKHLIGHSRIAFDELVALLDGSETDEYLVQSLSDMGPVIEPWLLPVAEKSDAPPCQRLACYRLECERATPDWPRVFALLSDFELGEQFARCADGAVLDRRDALIAALDVLCQGQMEPAGQVRLASWLDPDGLGAGGDGDQWPGLSLQQMPAIERLTSVDGLSPFSRSADAMPASAAPDAESSSPSDSDRNRAPLPPGATPIQPSMPIRASGAEPSAITPAPKVVEVFYGTNRTRAKSAASGHDLHFSVLATAGGAMLAMLLCLVGFVRSGNRAFALVAIVAIGLVAPLGFHAASRYADLSWHTTVSYDGGYRDVIQLGICKVSIPPGHKPGELESPTLLKLQIKQDINKHVVLTNIEELPSDKFFDGLHQTLNHKGKNILVFIHGYNVSFEDAARRTAQMAADVNFPGAPVFYSWPSQANWYGYTTDRENIELSVTQIKSFLLDLANKSGADTINLVAHSMGNVGLTQALKEMESSTPAPIFNQVVLAAPDIDADVFKSRVAPFIVSKARHLTLYTSQTDLALIASRYFNSGPRVGDSATGVLLFPGIDTIDATSVDSSLLGHSYYGSNITVLTDLGRVLENQPISSRNYLQAVADAAQPYWTFDPVRVSQSASTSATR